jgi:hypothetical protein
MKNKFRGACAWARGAFLAGLAEWITAVFSGFCFSASAFGQTTWAGNSAPEEAPLRVEVKFRPGLDQSFAHALRPDADALALATAYSALSFLARVDPTGPIDACNGTGYVATTINYSAGVPYHFRMVVNVFVRTCSADVTPDGGSELTVGLNDAFRTASMRLYPWNREVGSTPANCVLRRTSSIRNFAMPI